MCVEPCQVKTKFANDVLMQVLGAEMEPKYAAAISARLNTSSEKFGAKGLKFLDQERLMTIAMEEKKLMTDRLSKVCCSGGRGRGRQWGCKLEVEA
jgi:hypothetical protein